MLSFAFYHFDHEKRKRNIKNVFCSCLIITGRSGNFVIFKEGPLETVVIDKGFQLLNILAKNCI